MIFDKSKIKANFNRNAKNYELFADLQRQVASNLCKNFQKDIIESSDILDLGSGSGFVAKEINNLNFSGKKNLFQLDLAYNMLQFLELENLNIFNINGDIEKMPFLENSFDLITSSLALQWVSNFSDFLQQVKIIGKPDSKLIFSIFLDDTLLELKKVSNFAKVELSVNDFIVQNDLESLISNNFEDYEFLVENFTLEYCDIYDLLRFMKKIGASYSSKKTGDKILARGDFELLNQIYFENFSKTGKLYASWKVAYVKAIIKK